MTFAEAEIKPAGLEPAHSKHVESRANGAVSQSILADAKLPGPVVDGYLHDSETGVLDERRYETVHTLEGNERLNADAAHRLQGAACVAHAIAHKPAAHEVRDPAAKPFEQCVFSKGAEPADEIGAIFDLGEKLWDIPRIVLKVAVKQHDRPAPGSTHSGEHRRALARVPLELKHPHVWMALDALDRAVR